MAASTFSRSPPTPADAALRAGGDGVGAPVAATDVGDVATMLDAANRYVVAREDGALTLAVLATGAPRAALGAANRARAKPSRDGHGRRRRDLFELALRR